MKKALLVLAFFVVFDGLGLQVASAAPVLSTDATLSNLVSSYGAFGQTFALGTTSYTQSVSNATSSITVTPTANQANATITVNGTTVSSGSASGSLALNVGRNTITTVATAQDGTTTKTYTVAIIRAVAPPTISYSGPNSYTINNVISTLTPTAGGGASTSGGGFGSSLTLAGGLTVGGVTAGSADGTGTAATFNNPIGGVVDPTGTWLYVTDYSNNMIRKIVILTGVVTTLAGSTATGSTNATGTSATFNRPVGIVIDPTGTNLYIADQLNQMIRKIVISTGQVTTLAGSTTAGSANLSGTAATFHQPTGLAIDPTGTYLYVADQLNNIIRKIVISTGAVTTIAGGGSVGGIAAGHADGTGTAASFRNASGLALDPSGTYLYIGDNGNNLVRKIEISSNMVTTLAGGGSVGGTVAGSLNGTASAAEFNGNYGIAIDPSGTYLYVADRLNNLVRQIVVSTALVTTLAGTTTAGHANGTGTSATFYGDCGITVGPTGQIFVADLTNNLIRAIPAVPYGISPAFPAGLSFNTSTGAITGTPTALSAATTYTISAANLGGSATATVNIAVVSAPTTITSMTAASAYTNALSQTFTATFADAVTGLTTSNFSLTQTGVSGASITSVTGSGTTYTVTVNNGTGDGTIGLNLDNATNLSPGISTTLPFTGGTTTVDKTAPTVTIGAPSLSTTTTGPVTYSVTYADANFNSSTMIASNITLNTTGNATGTIGLTGSGTSYTVTLSSISGVGSLGISIAAATATDLAGNSAPASSALTTFAVVAAPIPGVNRYGQITIGADGVDKYGRIGGTPKVNKNGGQNP